MTEQNKPLKIEFAPGCFDQFDGSQEELNELMTEIQNMFANLTPEELAERSRPVDIDSLIEDGDEEAEAVLRALNAEPRNLQ
jgi:hypothetical protein